MSSKTRRSISLRGLTHQQVADYCKANGLSVSGYLEKLIAEDMRRKGIPRETVLRPRTWDGKGAKPGPKGPIRHGGVVLL